MAGGEGSYVGGLRLEEREGILCPTPRGASGRASLYYPMTATRQLMTGFYLTMFVLPAGIVGAAIMLAALLRKSKR